MDKENIIQRIVEEGCWFGGEDCCGERNIATSSDEELKG